MNLNVTEIVGIQLLHDQCGVLVDALQDLGQLVCGGSQSEDLMEHEIQNVQSSDS
jgi:hypothetical protein